jgi:flagellar export protein FliJ
MKRFQFPLDRVLRWRAGQAALEELKLEQLCDSLARLNQEKREVESRRSVSERDLLGQAWIQAAALQSLDRYRRHARDKIRDFEQQEKHAAAQMEEQRQRVIQARKNAELLERLKQKALEEWQAACDREQETLATELFLARRGREHRKTEFRIQKSESRSLRSPVSGPHSEF